MNSRKWASVSAAAWTPSNLRAVAALLALTVAAGGLAVPAMGQEARSDRPVRERSAGSSDDFAARRLLRKAADLLTAGEAERGTRMLETVIEQYPQSDVRFEALLALGKHLLDKHDQPNAIHYLGQCKPLGSREEPVRGKLLDTYLEAMYLTGVAHYRMKNFSAAFPILRRITNNHPNTVWANQAYYYVGMCHFAQGNWNKAIRALSLVGTFVDPDSPSVEYVEAGRRFYVKIDDADLPVLYRLGEPVNVEVSTRSGDSAVIPCIPLSQRGGVFIGSIGTEMGKPVDETKLAEPTDPVLQVIGGDELTVRYVDANTKQGDKDVAKTKVVKVVSTATVTFTLRTFEGQATAAYQDQPLYVHLRDVDEDRSAKQDQVAVRLISRFKIDEDEPVGTDLADLAFADQRQTWRTRDEVVVTLKELGEAPFHSGRFGGGVQLEPLREGAAPDTNDNVLTGALGDEVVASFVDDLHIAGESPRTVTASIRVVGEIDSRPRATQNVVSDPVLKSRKNLVEATAFLELARIFNSMGLIDGAGEKADEGLTRVDTIIKMRAPIPAHLREEAFKLRWELLISRGDYRGAIETCKLFHKMYPNSPFVDQALMGIGRIHFKAEDYRSAIGVFSQVLTLANSQVKPEAQFMIGQALEEQGNRAALASAAAKGTEVGSVVNESAIAAYRACAQKYPESEFAGQSLAKLVDYHVMTKDYPQADDLLDQVFQDYPDGQFLDQMLLKWVLVAYRMGNFAKAHEKCSQLMFEYPSSPHAATAKQLLPKIERKLGS